MSTKTELYEAAILAAGGTVDDLPDRLKSTYLKRLVECLSNGSGGGAGTKLYRHSIWCCIENTYTGDMIIIDDNNVITTNPTKYENINDVINDVIRCGGKFIGDEGGGLVFLANGWTKVYDGQVIENGLSYDILCPWGLSSVTIAELGDPWTIGVYFTDSKVEEV